jgi:chemotaxis protein methyltransferase CheR
MTDALLAQFQDLIRSRCGLQTDGIGHEPLLAAIQKRRQALGMEANSAYFAKLVGDEAEFQEFVTLLTINETYFFREPEQLTLLVERLMPRLLAEAAGRLPIRILSAGCSTGEEPYSIAMAMLEKFGPTASRMVRILGGDIDHHALAKARAGRYGGFSFRALSADLKARYFRPSGRDAWVVDDAVKAMVSFHPLNLLGGSFPPALSDLDVVFFRNVSIYFDEPTRRAIQQNLLAAMSDRGHLVIGSAETLANDLGVFRMVEEGGSFFFRRPDAAAPLARPPAPAPVIPLIRPLPPAPRPVTPPPAASAPKPTGDAPSVDAVRQLIRDKRFDRVDLLLGPRNRQAPADPALLALEGYAKALNRDFEVAKALGERALAADEWSVDAMVLLGLAAKWQNDNDTAVAWFKKAVYVRQDCWPAQYYLADALKNQGAQDAARRSYRMALLALGLATPKPDGGLVLPLGLPMAEIRFLCERQTTGAARQVGG